MSMDERTMLDSMGATSDDEGRAVALVSAVAASLWVTKGSPKGDQATLHRHSALVRDAT